MMPTLRIVGVKYWSASEVGSLRGDRPGWFRCRTAARARADLALLVAIVYVRAMFTCAVTVAITSLHENFAEPAAAV
jgi:hypothetical protein